MSIAFDTDSPNIKVSIQYGYVGTPVNTMGIAVRGVDLYIKKDGKWLWTSSSEVYSSKNEAVELIGGMSREMKHCLLYLPLLSEVYSVKVGVEHRVPRETCHPHPSQVWSEIAILNSLMKQEEALVAFFLLFGVLSCGGYAA